MADWSQTPDDYWLPDVRLTSDDAPWLADADVTSWSVERELVGPTLPGNIRARSGLSVGDASAVVAVDGDLLTPWSPQTVRRVTAGGAARLFVEADDGDEFNLGSWLIAPTGGSLTSRETQVDLIEAQYVGRDVPQALQPRGGGEVSPVDPAWMISRLVGQMGFYAAPPPVPGETIVAVPLDGSISDARSGYGQVGGEIPGWGVLDGDTLIGTLGTGNILISANDGAAAFAPTFHAGQSVYVTLNLTGSAQFLDFAQEWEVVVDADAATIAVKNKLSATAATVSYTPGLSADWPNRVQVEMQRTWGSDEIGWSSFRARARSGPDAAWSSWATQSTAYLPGDINTEIIYGIVGQRLTSVGAIVPAGPGQMAALQVSSGGPSVDLWRAPNAFLKPLGGSVQMPYLPPTDDVWTSVQNVAAAWMAAGHLDRDGDFRLLDRDDLAGANTTGEVTDVSTEWADLPWTQDPADTADRLVVSYNPPSITIADPGSTTPAPEFWRAEEIVELPPGQTITIMAEAERVAEGVFESFANAAALSGEPTLTSSYSIISAFTNREGTGTVVTEGFQAQATPLSPSRVEIKLRNNGAVPLYLVDAAGQPCLIVRAWKVGTFDVAQVAERGVVADAASNPVEIDLGRYVQTATDAEQVADYLWSRISGSGLWKASSVECRLDWSHDIAKVLRLMHPETGLEVKALVAKVAFDGGADQIKQALDLVLLPFTWGDWDLAYSGNTWATWDAIWAGRTWDEHDADPLNLGA